MMISSLISHTNTAQSQILSFAINGIIVADPSIDAIFGGSPEAKTIPFGLSSMLRPHISLFLESHLDRGRLYTLVRGGPRTLQGPRKLYMGRQRTFHCERRRYYLGIQGIEARAQHSNGLMEGAFRHTRRIPEASVCDRIHLHSCIH